jgi:signal transduction histidine kinase/HAMP domain-containing protein/DNA-binding response OmpR family regulator
MDESLKNQVLNIAEVTTAVASGDLSKKITVDVKGEILALKNTINTMVDQLNAFASEVTRVAREVGTEGKLGGQAQVEGVGGTWKDLTLNVNSMAANLTGQVRNIAEVTTAVANGDLSKTVTVEVRGELLALKNTINRMVDQLNAFASEVTRVAREVGTQGKLGGQAQVRGVGGTWKDLTDNVNLMADNLTSQVRNIAEVTTAVANGDLSRKITVEVRGEILELKDTINRMVDQLNAFASEVTRVAREVGTEGKLGGTAQVRGAAGIWKDLTDNVNTMAENLTAQVRGIARVVTAVARGDLARKLGLEAKGEIAVLADTINNMTDTLALFAEQVTSVAREVGVEGRLGGQAQVPGASGTWRDLTDNVNQLAANLTTQVRSIAEVATAVTEGDLTRSITVEAKGEVAALKDNINEMIRNLKETTQKNQEQDWLNSNLARIGRMLQGQRDRQAVCRLILSELARLADVQHGAFFVCEEAAEQQWLVLAASYAYKERKVLGNRFKLGEGLVGQAAVERERILLTNVPADYVISSGLGEARPLNIVVLPVLFEDQVKAVIELASFNRYSDVQLGFLEQLGESIGIVLNTIEATMRTEQLLRQSQSLTERLQSQQDELQETNEQLEEKAKLLTEQKAQVEVKNREVELARQALEEKAEQHALTSKYKSEFLANMSHELRTPLNSLLVLARLLADNPDANLSDKQVEFARTIHSSGSDLLGLINEILDLSKIESGKMPVDVTGVGLQGLADDLVGLFRELADDKKLGFEVNISPALPMDIETDGKRLKQVLRNLLSNAFKFTEQGVVELSITPAAAGWGDDRPSLDTAEQVVAFSIRDTGIGIAKDKQRVIFEAFQQADGTTSRRYGGTGLGLSISREIAMLLGGDIRVDSTPAVGSTFTLYLPVRWPGGLATFGGEMAHAAPAGRTVLHAHRIQVGANLASAAGGPPRLLAVSPEGPRLERISATAASKGWDVVTARRPVEAVGLLERVRPAGIVLDLAAEDRAGWNLLAALKEEGGARHVPVLALCDTDCVAALRLGAHGWVAPDAPPDALAEALTDLREVSSRAVKRVLIVSDDMRARVTMEDLLRGPDLEILAATTGAEALDRLRAKSFDAVVLDPSLPGSEAFDLLDAMQEREDLALIPVIAHASRELTDEQQSRLQAVAQRLVVKDARTHERLLAEAALHLHRAESRIDAATRRRMARSDTTDPLLAGQRVLIVDDDVRNVFALTSALEQHGMEVTFAENGRVALEQLAGGSPFGIVLMDIMMPEMDGFATMKAMRARSELRDIPIVALTAKAMKGDREACLAAGANDYITKPVDLDHLLRLMRTWLHS